MESNENIVAIVERLVKNEMDKKDNINSKCQCIKITLTILLTILGAYIYFKFFNRIYIDEIIKFNDTPSFPLINPYLAINKNLFNNKFQMICGVFFYPLEGDRKLLQFINFNSSKTFYHLEIDNITLKEGDEIHIVFDYNDIDKDTMDELVINYMHFINFDIYILNSNYSIGEKKIKIQSKHFSIGEEIKSYKNANYTKFYEYKLLSNTIKDINMEVTNFSSLSDYEIVRSYMYKQPNITIKAKWGIKLTKGETHKIIEVKKMYTIIDRFFLLLSLFTLFTNIIHLIINYIKCKNKEYLEKNRLTLNEENVNNRRDINE